jgi:predicted Ser/Thr protein kinase
MPKFAGPPVADLAGLFPQLEVLELIGQGGMGAVYRARQPGLDRLVAIKVLPPDLTGDPGFAERFAREARALARLNHPNIVGVYDFGRAGGLHYFIMEYVDGLNLRELKHGGRLSPPEAMRIIPQMCDALQFAHDEGIVHRDIKPENVMVDKRGRVKITDFGLAKLLGREPESPRLTGAADVMGTPHYMAPEQVDQPQAVDHRADIYSLGVVFYELLTGELPLGKFAPPSRKVEVDVRLDEVVLHTLEREPDRRYQHASQVKTDVENIARSPDAPHPPPLTAASPEVATTEDARRQVNGPALGLVVTAILNWIGIPLVLLFSVYLAWERIAGGSVMVWLPVAALVLSSVMLVAGLKMKRLQAYWLAVAGSLLAILVAPGNVVGLPVGIWALVVLSQQRVRESFGKELPVSSQAVPNLPATGGGWKVAAVIVAAVLFITAIPIGAILVAIALPALQRAKARAEMTQTVAPVREVTMRALAGGQGSEALDLDSGRLLDIPAELLNPPGSNTVAWLEENGADLVVNWGGGQWAFLTPGTRELTLLSVPNDLWLNPVVDPPPAVMLRVFQETHREENMVVHVLATNVQPPFTLKYRTAEGGEGLLRIQGFGEDHARVKLQFKRHP